MTQATAERSFLPAHDDEQYTERVPLTDPRAGAVSADPRRGSGVPCFAGTRVPIRDLFDYLAGGESLGSFLESFPIDRSRLGSCGAGGGPCGKGCLGMGGACSRTRFHKGTCVAETLRENPGHPSRSTGCPT